LLRIFKNNGVNLEQINDIVDDCWIHLENPSTEELTYVYNKTMCNHDYLYASLDLEEMPRIEKDDAQCLTVVNVVNDTFDENLNLFYDTIPLGIIIMDNYFITVSSKPLDCINSLINRTVRIVSTMRKNRLLIQILYNLTNDYLKALQKIDKVTGETEISYREKPNNEAVVKLLSLEKTLIYFKSSIRANQSVINKLNRFKWIHEYDGDSDLLEDTIIEINQASDMTDINISVTNSLLEAFSILISNNLNITMKILASITILLTVPTMIYGFYGINTPLETLPHFMDTTSFVLILSIVVTATIFIILKKKDLL
jgi:magnesium transporter